MTKPRDIAAMPAALLKLPAESFVRAAIKALGATTVTPRDANALTQAILRGVNKSRIWAALQARSEGTPSSPPPVVPTAIVRPDDEIVVEEILTSHAPSDDVVFLEYAAFRLMGRDVQLHERLRFQDRLNNGVSRSEIIQEIVDIARAEGRNPTVARMTGDTPFSLISAECSDRLVLMLSLGDRGLMVTGDALSFNAFYKDDGLEVSEGLVLAGPKKPLRPGLWRLNVDWRQHRDSVICVEATANAGLEKLFSMTLAGRATFSSEFRTLPEYLVCEVLIFAIRKGEPDDEPWIVRPQEVSLTWVAE